MISFRARIARIHAEGVELLADAREYNASREPDQTPMDVGSVLVTISQAKRCLDAIDRGDMAEAKRLRRIMVADAERALAEGCE